MKPGFRGHAYADRYPDNSRRLFHIDATDNNPRPEVLVLAVLAVQDDVKGTDVAELLIMADGPRIGWILSNDVDGQSEHSTSYLDDRRFP